MDGLDLIAITDHVDSRLQKQKNAGLLNCDRNMSYELAAKAAKKAGVMVIHGGEISRGMAPGHWNCLFVKDNEAIAAAAEKNNDDEFKAAEGGLTEAHAQGAFTYWNHPHWERQAPNQTRWYDEHTKLYDAGLMNGIEIFNAFSGYSPEAHAWAMQRNLTLMSGTDCHSPLFTEIDYQNGELRPMTLVFAKEKSLDGVREALDAHRTAVFAKGEVYGREEVLLPLFTALFDIQVVSASGNRITFKVVNRSSIPLRMSKGAGDEDIIYPRHFTLRPNEEITFGIAAVEKTNKIGEKGVDLHIVVDNFHTDADKCLLFNKHFTAAK